MINRLKKLANYLSSSGELARANYIFKLAQIQEISAAETDRAIEQRIRELSSAWVKEDQDALDESGIDRAGGISQLRYAFDRLLGFHSNPWSLLGGGWRIDLDQYDRLNLFKPDGSIGSDDSDDPVDYVALYLVLKIEEEFSKYDVPEPHSILENRRLLEESMEVPEPEGMNKLQEEGWNFNFPEYSSGMHADYSRRGEDPA
jgi:hypothetical protein